MDQTTVDVVEHGTFRPHETGSAAGLLNAVQQLSATLGVALLGTVFLHHHTPEPAFWLAAGLVAATAAATVAMRADPAF